MPFILIIGDDWPQQVHKIVMAAKNFLMILVNNLSNSFRHFRAWFKANSESNKMDSSRINPEKIKLVAFLKDRIGDYENPLRTSEAIRIVRMIFNENGNSLSGIDKQVFLARAREIFQKNLTEIQDFCPICFKYFHNWQDRDRHVEKVHEKRESSRFKCMTCSKTYMCGTSLDYHIKTVHSKSSVACLVCQKTFSHELVLKRHKKSVHMRRKPEIVCKICEASFSRKDSLQKHKERSHKTYRFAFDDAMIVLAHKGGFKCKLCDEEFSGKGADENLKQHLARKCQKKNGVQCGQCGAPFTHQWDLKKHINIKHRSGSELNRLLAGCVTSKQTTRAV